MLSYKTILPTIAKSFTNLFRFYVNGFRRMTVGRTLWMIILIKLFIMFAVLKIFFFPDILHRDYDTDEERAEAVRRNLTDFPNE